MPDRVISVPQAAQIATRIKNKFDTVNGRLGGQKIGTEFEWEIGSLTPGRGTVTTSATRIRSKFIPVTNGTHITLSAPTNRLLVYCYDANKLYVSDSPWLEYNEYTIDNVNVAYVRILIRKGTSNTTIVDSEVEGLASGLAISYSVPFEVYTELRSVVTDTEKLNSRLDELDSFSREWSVETKTVSVSVTVGHEVGGSTQHLIDVNIPAGKEFTFIINGESGILTKYALYANGSKINSSCDFGTKYTFTASADITYIGIYAIASWATSTGTVNAVLEVLTYNENSLEVQKADKAELVGYVSKELMQKCKIVHQEASPNKWNPETAVNGMVHTDGRLLTGGPYDNYCHESIGHVNEGDVITGYLLASPYGVIQRIAAYDANGNVVSSAGATEVRTYTVPAGVASLTITVSDIRSESCMILVNADEAPTQFMPYAEEADFYVATEGFWEPVKPTINLPKKIYAVVGFELNIYFENIVEDWTKYDWNVDCTVGKQMERGYQITPTASDVGTKTLTITATDEYGNVNTVIASLVITAATAGSGTKSVLVLGDSTTANGIVIEKLHADFDGGSMSVNTLGTRGTSPYNHEGRSGWKLNDYFTKEYIDYTDDRGHVANPFYNPSTQTFDAAYYFANSGIAVPDFFIINMGVNDVFSFTSDTALNAGIDQFISYVDAAITSIKAAAPNTKICICCTIPPNHSQDAFGKAYACGQTRNRCKRNNTLLVDRIIEEYDGRESENIYMIPIHTNLDTVYNMGMETLPVNARNTDITYQSPILNGGVHPMTSGYWQIADVYTAFIKAHA